jgi:FlaA1/EpsC-like NDP-sugar epimerase
VSYIADISDEIRMEWIFNLTKPVIVFHAAAYKHVPVMELHPTEAIKNNVLGTKVIADLSVKHGVQKFVMVSTDKAVNPTNVMGASKRIAEIYTQSLNNQSDTNFITTRFGNVLDSAGSVIPRFRKQIQKGGPLTITHPEITRFFMTISEACELVLEAGAMGKGGEIFLFDMGRAVKIIELAQKMIKLSGLEIGKDIQIVYTGLRPGEKLFEELLNNNENNMPTHNKMITIAKVISYNYEEIYPQIIDLINLYKTNDSFSVVSKMKQIVPEFTSRNSVFEELDTNKAVSHS